MRLSGLYVDLDTECWRPADAFLQDADVVLQGTNAEKPAATNSAMAGAPGHPLWDVLIGKVHEAWAADHGARAPFLAGPPQLRASFETFKPQPKRGQQYQYSGRHKAGKTTILVHHPVSCQRCLALARFAAALRRCP